MARSGGLPYANEIFDYFPRGEPMLTANQPLPGGELPPVKTVKRGKQGAALRDNSKRPTQPPLRRISLESNASGSSEPSEKDVKKRVKVAREPVCLAGMARKWDVPFETVKTCSELFRRNAEPLNANNSDDILKVGRIGPKNLGSLVCSMAGVNSLDELSDETGEESMISDGYLNFEEFVAWYNRRAFSDYFNLSKESRECRHVAEALGIPVAEAERCQRLFAKFDSDGNDYLDFKEFSAFVNSLVGKKFDSRNSYEVPESRVTHVWKQCDSDGSGHVTFKEFATFCSKRFEPGSFDLGDSLSDSFYHVRKSCLITGR
jgi:Ca2+-binding EF-hand superfamily protein